MKVITGGNTNGIEFSCMYDANDMRSDLVKEKDGNTLYGFYGIACNKNDATSVLWFDKDMNFVEGEILRTCINCTWCGQSGGGFFRECLSRGFQIDNEMEYSCNEIELSV